MEKAMVAARLMDFDGFILIDETDENKVNHLNNQMLNRMQSIRNELQETIKSKQKKRIHFSDSSDLPCRNEIDRHLLDLLEFKLGRIDIPSQIENSAFQFKQLLENSMILNVLLDKVEYFFLGEQ